MESTNTYSVIANYCKIRFLCLQAIHSYWVIKKIPLSTLYWFSLKEAKALLFLSKELRSGILHALQVSFPESSHNSRVKISQNNIAHVLLQNTIKVIMPYLSEKEFSTLFETSEFETFLTKSSKKKLLLAGSHFYAFMLVSVLGEILYRNQVSLCSTFLYPKYRIISKYTKDLHKRYHSNFHVPINTEDSTKNFINFIRHARKGNGATLVFTDVRMKTQHSDIGYYIGKQIFNSNNGYNYLVNNTDNKVVAIQLILAGNKFTLQHRELTAEQARQNYYSEILPEIIESNIEQWQNWFMAPILITKPTSSQDNE